MFRVSGEGRSNYLNLIVTNVNRCMRSKVQRLQFPIERPLSGGGEGRGSTLVFEIGRFSVNRFGLQGGRLFDCSRWALIRAWALKLICFKNIRYI